MPDIQLYNGDCFEVMKSIPDKSVDAIITDIPYGVVNRKQTVYGIWTNLTQTYAILMCH